MSEINIQKAVIQYLTLRGYFFWRNNTGALKTEGGGFVRFGAKGSPDIFVLTKGGFLICLEIKDKKGKQNENQLEWQRKCEELGAKYYVIRDVLELKQIGL